MNDTPSTGPKKRPIRWMWVLLAFFVFKGLIGAYHGHNLGKMQKVTEDHKARAAALINSSPDASPSTQEGRDRLREFQNRVCDEMHQTEAEIRAANDNMLMPANAADLAAGYKVCADTFQLLDLADKAVWVKGASGYPVVQDGPLKDRYKALLVTLASDQKTLDAAEKVANDRYEAQQKSGK
jgi:hypothetical protein